MECPSVISHMFVDCAPISYDACGQRFRYECKGLRKTLLDNVRTYGVVKRRGFVFVRRSRLRNHSSVSTPSGLVDPSCLLSLHSNRRCRDAFKFPRPRGQATIAWHVACALRCLHAYAFMYIRSFAVQSVQVQEHSFGQALARERRVFTQTF